jgi:hypothetical protein
MATEPDYRYPKPTYREWLLFISTAVCFIFAVFLIVTAPSKPLLDPDKQLKVVGALVLMMLVPAVFAFRIIWKLRRRRGPPAPTKLSGGVPIGPSRTMMFVLCVITVGLGVVTVWFGGDWHYRGLSLQPFGWPLAAFGIVGLVMVATGRLDIGRLQFDPPGITIKSGSWSYMIPWDNISRMKIIEWHRAPVLLIGLRRWDAVKIDPLERTPEVMKHLEKSAARFGAPVVVYASIYRLDLPPLVRALERYVRDPAARAELSRPRRPSR